MAKQKIIARGALCLAVGITSVTPAFAGGLERGGYNIDLLFDNSRFAAESAATFVAPQRKLKNVVDTDPSLSPGGGDLTGLSTTANDSESYWVPRVGLKAGFGDAVDCMVDYSQPWGAHTKPGANWAGANENIETKVKSDNYALTCSYKFDVGQGQLRFIGGGFYQELSGFKERQVTPPFGGGTGVGRLDLKGDGWGWRAGVAYEIPEYALRASLVYNSAVKLDDITGTLNLSQVAALGGPVIGVHGSQDMPDSLEFKFQTGIAPGWLALGSVKWTDWSQFSTIPFYCSSGVTVPGVCNIPGGRATSLDLGYRDGWTVSGGLGHKFNDQWSGAVTVTWDRGTSQGFGTQTDTWTLGAGVQHAVTENIELRVAGAIGLLTSGSSRQSTIDGVNLGNGVSYDFGNDIVAAVSTSLKVKF